MCCNSGHHPEISRPLSGLHHKGTHRAPLSTCWTHIEQFYNNDFVSEVRADGVQYRI